MEIPILIVFEWKLFSYDLEKVSKHFEEEVEDEIVAQLKVEFFRLYVFLFVFDKSVLEDKNEEIGTDWYQTVVLWRVEFIQFEDLVSI